MHVGDAGVLLLYRQDYIVLNHFPVWFVGHGIVRNLVDVLGHSKIVERLRSFLLVESKFPNGVAQCLKIRSQRAFARCLYAPDRVPEEVV